MSVPKIKSVQSGSPVPAPALAASSSQPSRPTAGRELLGLTFCLMAAVFYTVANIALRYLAGAQANPMTVIFFKELVSVVALVPVLLWQGWHGKRVFVSARVVAVLAAVGLAVQLGANVGQQWALGIIGLAVVSPTIFAAMLGSSAILGFLLLGEKLSWQAIIAVVLVVLAIVSLNMSVQEAEKSRPAVPSTSRENPAQDFIRPAAGAIDLRQISIAEPGLQQSTSRAMGRTVWIVLALLTCCGAGIIYSLLGIAIRWARLQGASVESTVFLVTLMGVVGLGPFVYFNNRLNPVALDSRLLVFMLVSGVANLLGFASITKGYQMTRVLYANMANATQVAFGALAGVVLFGEAVNRWLILGVALSLSGVLLMGYTAAQENNRPASLKVRSEASG